MLSYESLESLGSGPCATVPRPTAGAGRSGPGGREVVVSGLGMLTPAGRGIEALWGAVCAGRSLAERQEVLAGLPVQTACRVPGLDADADAVLGRRLARRLDRFAHLAVIAARDAVADAVLDPECWDGTRVGVVLGVGSNSMVSYEREFRHMAGGQPHYVSPVVLPRSVPSAAAAEVAIDLGVRGPGFTVAAACASGAQAIAVGADLIASGSVDVVITGSGESGLCRVAATCFAQLAALSRREGDPALASRPFDRERDGFVLSEAGAVLVLEAREHMVRRGGRARAVLAGHASSCDAHNPVAPDPQGLGAEQALRHALERSGVAVGEVGHVNAHGTGTQAGDAAEARCLLRVFGAAQPPVTASKGVLGHSLGASGAVEAAVTILSLERGLLPPTANLGQQDVGLELDLVTGQARPTRDEIGVSTSFGFGGFNTALVFARP